MDPATLIPSVLWPGFSGTSVPPWLAAELDRGLAGVVLFSGNVESPDQVRRLCAEIRSHNPAALIAIDEEGGTVTRLESIEGSTLPSAAALGAFDDVLTTEAVGGELARRCLELGIDVLLSPVADVNTDPANPVIGIRSFGADADLVGRHVAAAVRGIVDAGARCCLKHFPGHGDTTADSHHDLPVSGADEATQDAVHLPPFLAGIAAGAPMVMSAHVVVPHLGPDPATLNPRALGLLRAAGFEGVIASDALEMNAIAETVGIGGGAVAALAAGVDLLCLGNPAPGADRAQYAEAYDALSAAYADGRLPHARLVEAVARVRACAAPRPGTLPAPAGFDHVARAVLRGDVPRLSPGPVALLDLRHRVNMAAGAVADRFGAELRRAGIPCDHVSVSPDRPLPPRPAGQVLALTDDLRVGSWQRSARAELGDPPTIHAGLPVAEPGVLNCLDSSRLAAREVAACLVG